MMHRQLSLERKRGKDLKDATLECATEKELWAVVIGCEVACWSGVSSCPPRQCFVGERTNGDMACLKICPFENPFDMNNVILNIEVRNKEENKELK